MSEIPQVVGLAALAKSNPEGAALPGTSLSVRMVKDKQAFKLEQDTWLLVLEGELIVDLPFGDFRILKQGESLHLPGSLDISWQPLDEVVLLQQYG